MSVNHLCQDKKKNVVLFDEEKNLVSLLLTKPNFSTSEVLAVPENTELSFFQSILSKYSKTYVYWTPGLEIIYKSSTFQNLFIGLSLLFRTYITPCGYAIGNVFVSTLAQP